MSSWLVGEIWMLVLMLGIYFLVFRYSFGDVFCRCDWFTGISAEREYVRDGKLTKMVIVELTDHM
jgi:hypothetical protein